MNNIKYKYFKFKHGRFFRLDESKFDFQILNNDNMWEDDTYIISLFIDPSSDYYEIKDKDIINKLEYFTEKEKTK